MGKEPETMLRFGTIGTGWIANSYVDGALDSGLWQLTAVYSRTKEKGLAFAAPYGVKTIFTDLEEMAATDKIDAVYIASPNKLHIEQARVFLEHGKHVIVEKPAAVTRGDVQRLIDAARANGVYFFEAITTLFMPQYEACRLLLPKLGRIEQAHITYAQYSSRYDAYLRGENPNIFNPAMQAGALNDMGVYCVHMAVDLFGAPQDVRYLAELGPNGIDLAGRLTLTYPSLTCEILTAKNADLGSGCRITGENGWPRTAWSMNLPASAMPSCSATRHSSTAWRSSPRAWPPCWSRHTALHNYPARHPSGGDFSSGGVSFRTKTSR